MLRTQPHGMPEAQIHGAAAGLHLMITFEARCTDVDLAAAAFDRGVKVQPLSWHCQKPHRTGLVLGYAASPVGTIEQGISMLGQSYRDLQRAVMIKGPAARRAGE